MDKTREHIHSDYMNDLCLLCQKDPESHVDGAFVGCYDEIVGSW